MNLYQNKLLAIAVGVLLLASMVYAGREAAFYVDGSRVNVKEERMCVVIDAGHGGGRLR